MRKNWILWCLCALLLIGCGSKEKGETMEIGETAGSPETGETVEMTLPEKAEEAPANEDFVRVREYVPGVWQELRYATEGNFTGKVIYDFTDAYLRYGTVKKLIAVSEELAQQGLYLKIWDGFRPVKAQFALWEVCPDPNYVANPNVGHSSHSRGNTVDLTLVDRDGWEVEMPTEFDDFSALADRDYSDCTETAAQNARLLEETMERHGFKGYYGEWWHFADTEVYPVEEDFYPE